MNIINFSQRKTFNLHHRKSELYTMQWPTDTQLHQMTVVAAPYGGPMAIVRDHKQFVKVGGSTVKPVIRIFTAAGNQLAAINVRIINE